MPAVEARSRHELLTGTTVVELSGDLSTSYCGRLLADAGARVVRHPAEPSALGRLLDAYLHDGKDVDAAAPLSQAAVAVGAGAGVDPVELREAFPRLVVVCISPFGLDGPWAARPATEHTLQAWCGSIGSRGRRDGPPVATGGRVGEWVTGAFAAVGALTALRRPGDEGELVDVSMLEVLALTSLSYPSLWAAFERTVGRETDNFFPRSGEVPGVVPTADGHVGISLLSGQHLEDLFVLIERPDLLDDPELRTPPGRRRRADELRAATTAWTTTLTTEEVVEATAAFRLPASAVESGRTLCRSSALAARLCRPAGTGVLQPDVPYRIELGPGGGRSSSAADGRDDLPFAGVRVADFTAYWAGPFVTQYLASMGADVVHVESIQRPDGMRFASVLEPGRERWWEWSPVFHGVNAGKRSVTVDLHDRRGIDLARRLVAASDVVVENFSPRVLEQVGLGWEAVAELNPAAVMVRMPAFGLSGPLRDMVGFAQTIEYASGLAWRTGLPDGLPTAPKGVADAIAGVHALVALLAALAHRDRTGRGALVESAMVDAALAVTAEQVLAYDATGEPLGREGNRGPGAPQGVYRCAGGDDDWVALAVATDEQWAGLRRALGEPAWAGDPALASSAGRRDRHDELDDRLSAWCADRTDDEVVATLLAAGVPAAPVASGRDLAANEQLRARGFFQAVTHDVTGTHLQPGLPVRLAGRTGPWHRRPAPTLGEHNREVLCGLLGLSDDELADLDACGVVGTTPVGA